MQQHRYLHQLLYKMYPRLSFLIYILYSAPIITS
nr:MAG TPA: hypothetical protein [Caudoviricetes sp.]